MEVSVLKERYMVLEKGFMGLGWGGRVVFYCFMGDILDKRVYIFFWFIFSLFLFIIGIYIEGEFFFLLMFIFLEKYYV